MERHCQWYFGTFLNIPGNSYQMHIIYAYIRMDTIQSTVPWQHVAAGFRPQHACCQNVFKKYWVTLRRKDRAASLAWKTCKLIQIYVNYILTWYIRAACSMMWCICLLGVYWKLLAKLYSRSKLAWVGGTSLLLYMASQLRNNDAVHVTSPPAVPNPGLW